LHQVVRCRHHVVGAPLELGGVDKCEQTWFGVVADEELSVLVAVLASALARTLAARLGTWTAVVAGVAVYLLVMAVGGSLLPAVDEVPTGFPATVLYDFRLASLGIQAVLWAVLGLVFGALIEIGARRRPVPATV
jgi:hypothetical protein